MRLLIFLLMIIAIPISAFPISTGISSKGNIGEPSYTHPTGEISSNKFIGALDANETVTGNWEEIVNEAVIQLIVHSDVSSAVDGLEIQFSIDGTIVDDRDHFTIPANNGQPISVQPSAEYWRVVYTNGPNPSTYTRIGAILKSTYVKPSSHRVGDGIDNEDDAEAGIVVITGQSDIDGNFDNIITYRGALQVDTALVHEVGVNRQMWRELGATASLTVAVTTGDTSVTVDDATGITIGDEVIFRNTNHESNHHYDVVGVAGLVVTVNRPIDDSYLIGDSLIEIDYSMNENGSLASPISYRIEPLPTDRYQITRILIRMLDNVVMDDSKFGGLTALTNGVVLRTYINGVYRTFSHWQDNSALFGDMFDVTYSDKAPAGLYGLSGRWTFTKAEFALDIDGANGDYFEVLIQDDLTDLTDFNIKVQGRVFGE